MVISVGIFWEHLRRTSNGLDQSGISRQNCQVEEGRKAALLPWNSIKQKGRALSHDSYMQRKGQRKNPSLSVCLSILCLSVFMSLPCIFLGRLSVSPLVHISVCHTFKSHFTVWQAKWGDLPLRRIMNIKNGIKFYILKKIRRFFYYFWWVWFFSKCKILPHSQCL